MDNEYTDIETESNEEGFDPAKMPKGRADKPEKSGEETPPSESATEGTGEDTLPKKKSTKSEKVIKSLKKQIKELSSKVAEVEKGKPPVIDKKVEKPEEKKLVKPDPEKFEDHDKYIEALTDYKAEIKFKEFEEKQAKRQKDDAEAAKQDAQKNSWAKKVDASKAKYKDFDKYAYRDDVPFNPAIAQAAYESDIGADVIYYLGKNPEKAKELADLASKSPIEALKRFGVIEKRVRFLEKKAAEVKAGKGKEGEGETQVTEKPEEKKPQTTYKKKPKPASTTKGQSGRNAPKTWDSKDADIDDDGWRDQRDKTRKIA